MSRTVLNVRALHGSVAAMRRNEISAGTRKSARRSGYSEGIDAFDYLI